MVPPPASDARCPTCRAPFPQLLGPSSFSAWAESPEVARLRQSSGDLYRCTRCHLVFRHPVPSPAELAVAYASIPAASWQYEPPPRWKWMKTQIERHSPNRRVLDVGCFRGDFLTTLDPQYEQYGIEPNAVAAEMARGHGIRIIGSDAGQDLPGYEGFFGTIILVDVAEHLPDPAATFRHLRRWLAPQGLLLVLTGNADSWAARASLPFYWYMSFPIHLVYLGERYFRWVAKTDGWHLRGTLRYSHLEGTRPQRWREGHRAIRLALWKRALQHTGWGQGMAGSRLFRRAAAVTEPPCFFHLRDHLGVVLTGP